MHVSTPPVSSWIAVVVLSVATSACGPEETPVCLKESMTADSGEKYCGGECEYRGSGPAPSCDADELCLRVKGDTSGVCVNEQWWCNNEDDPERSQTRHESIECSATSTGSGGSGSEDSGDGSTQEDYTCSSECEYPDSPLDNTMPSTNECKIPGTGPNYDKGFKYDGGCALRGKYTEVNPDSPGCEDHTSFTCPYSDPPNYDVPEPTIHYFCTGTYDLGVETICVYH